MCCSTCQCVFGSRDEQVEHYKLDWHRFNLKQKLIGRVAVSMQEFEDKTCAGDVSSISGSDGEDSSEEIEMEPLPAHTADSDPTESGCEEGRNMGNQPYKVLFRNAEGKFLSVHRCALSTWKGTELELVESLRGLHSESCWVILMAGGGHFAGAVFKGTEVLRHKTFHRYTVRAKRGTSQGLHDSQSHSSMPRSAGASLRRYNEVALVKDIQGLLETWAQHLQDAHAIFLRAAGQSRAVFYGRKNSPLQKSDPRVWSIPFATRRATFKEVKRVHAVLSVLNVYGKDTDVTDMSSPKKVWKKVKTITLKKPLMPDEGGSSEKSEEEEELGPAVELVMEEECLKTLHLQEFEVFPKRNRKKKKKKDGKNPSGGLLHCPGTPLLQLSAGTALKQEALKTPGHQEQKDALSYQLRNDLFTICKTGDANSLQRLLRPLLQEAPASEERLTVSVLASVRNGDPADQAGEGMIGSEALIPAYGTRQAQARADDDLSEWKESEKLQEVTEQPECDRLDDQEVSVIHALPNEQINSAGFTLLHVAAAMGQCTIAEMLMDAGWDPAVRDAAGQTPYSVSADRQTRNVFRKYQANHPEKFDYSTAKIPGPLTAEIEAKKLEKRRVQKAQRRQREKEEKEKRKQEEEEAAERSRFAALSDREKRALAAERRFAAQQSSEGAALRNPRRCWMCGESLLGRTPFQYLDFAFCSTQCLQHHRKSRAGNS
ncbi:ankyrin repeat and zinc finger domain-containing protein 1-like [Rhinatrema bivittatum]|uniref:ankyrin repeat and zinc finger domain-containing protein 1-like n=1 Tax=Rhinatrema bivittatum TaxID=194408 RepID=UPI00112A740D|nr:ankyrin repeat and zinc finger domain-containing protein 1-like [Rhinatrema bivittatum]